MSKQEQQAPELSPKMQMVTAELKEVLARYDVAAVVVLHEPGAVNYFLKVDPSYSLATMKNDKMALAPAPLNLLNPDAVPELAAQTVNMFRNLASMTQRLVASLGASLMTSQAFYNLYPPGVKPINGKKPGKK